MSEDKQRAIEHIRKAWAYNASARGMTSCNQHYMGSLATYRLGYILGTTDWSQENLDKLAPATLLEAAKYLEDHSFTWERVGSVKLNE